MSENERNESINRWELGRNFIFCYNILIKFQMLNIINMLFDHEKNCNSSSCVSHLYTKWMIKTKSALLSKVFVSLLFKYEMMTTIIYYNLSQISKHI